MSIGPGLVNFVAFCHQCGSLLYCRRLLCGSRVTPLSSSLADPAWPSPLLGALDWIERVLLGDVAAVVAVLAVAGVGAAMLTGRTDLRRGAQIAVGCFILFGAATIAGGIRTALDGAAGGEAMPVALAQPSPQEPSQPPKPAPAYDPYAGASVFVGPH